MIVILIVANVVLNDSKFAHGETWYCLALFNAAIVAHCESES